MSDMLKKMMKKQNPAPKNHELVEEDNKFEESDYDEEEEADEM